MPCKICIYQPGWQKQPCPVKGVVERAHRALPVAKVAEALLWGHGVAELIALSPRALNGGRVEVVLAAAGGDVCQLPLVSQPLRLVDVVGAPSPLQGGPSGPPGPVAASHL